MRKYQVLIIFFVILAASMFSPVRPSDFIEKVVLTAAVEPPGGYLGDTITLNIKLSHIPSVQCKLNDVEALLASYKIRHIKRSEFSLFGRTFNIVKADFTSYTTGDMKISGISADYNNTLTNTSAVISAPDIEFSIKGRTRDQNNRSGKFMKVNMAGGPSFGGGPAGMPGGDSSDTYVRASDGPIRLFINEPPGVKIPFERRKRRILAILSGGLVLLCGAGLFIFVRHLQKKRRSLLTPAERILSALNATDPEGMIKDGKIQDLLDTIHRLTKETLLLRLERPKLELTPAELNALIMSADMIPDSLKKSLIHFFEHCSSLKYSGGNCSESTALALFNFGKVFIENQFLPAAGGDTK
ncbi:MAG TPA: hypothetical protein PKG81_06345 [Candidatus Omnitrophota bacterium]|nr:hypothetical protein [Candidatus Omnitrophota bacterium]